MDPKDLFKQVESLQQEMVAALVQLICVPAIAPENGGEGELAKAELFMKTLVDAGFDRVERFDADDERVPSGKRPNIVAYLNGESPSKRLWVVTHLDVVPAGEESLWRVTKPFEPKVVDGKVYGRGSEDNGQSLVSSVFAAKALKKLGVMPGFTFAVAIVSDEEQGSVKGIQHLLNKGLFRSGDLVIVPDHGTPKGDRIEIAEKGILWLKVVTLGVQSHGSLPNKGLNAHRVGMQVALEFDTWLHQKFKAQNNYFDVPYSTFEPTRKDRNVEAINIVPGEDILYFDCRVLPQYSLDEVFADLDRIRAEYEAKTGAKIRLEVIQKQSSPPVPESADAVLLLKQALKVARGIDAELEGVGGGTCAAFFRNAGIPAIVWSTIDEIPHQPDEYAWISHMVDDAKVYALLATMKMDKLEPNPNL